MLEKQTTPPMQMTGDDKVQKKVWKGEKTHTSKREGAPHRLCGSQMCTKSSWALKILLLVIRENKYSSWSSMLI